MFFAGLHLTTESEIAPKMNRDQPSYDSLNYFGNHAKKFIVLLELNETITATGLLVGPCFLMSAITIFIEDHTLIKFESRHISDHRTRGVMNHFPRNHYLTYVIVSNYTLKFCCPQINKYQISH